VLGDPAHRYRTEGHPNRIMFRGGPDGGDYKYAVERERSEGPFPHRGPDEGYLMGARNVDPVNGGGDWVCEQAEHWMFAGHRDEEGGSHSRPDRLGISWRCAQGHTRTGDCGCGHGVAGRGESSTMDGHNLSGAEAELCFQRLHHFLESGVEFAFLATCCRGHIGPVHMARMRGCNGLQNWLDRAITPGS